MQKIQVRTKNPYEIIIGNDINCGAEIKPFVKTDAILLHDANLPKSMVEKVVDSLQAAGVKFSVIALKKSGEDVKTFAYFEEVTSLLMEKKATRKTTLIALGGGTVGDFIGFVAATFMRGVPFVQIPTTLLSMVDSSVGGKVAINLGHYKNCIGAFYQPQTVLIDTSFLASLPLVELISGYAEVIKYGFIHDVIFFEYLLQNENVFASLVQNRVDNNDVTQYLTHIISCSCEIKADFVCRDETELLGIREMLNFGHTFAHAFEGLYLGKIPHGIAVGIGMIYACEYSKIPTENVIKHYKQIGLEYSITKFCTKNNIPLPKTEEIVTFMQKDKKNTSNNIKLILLKEIGKSVIKERASSDVMAFVERMLKLGY